MIDFAPEKVLYIEIDDEITTVYDRLKKLKQKRIAMVFPKRAILLESVVNLKILKKKYDELEKEVMIICSDLHGRNLAEKAGILTAERLFEKEGTPALPQPLPPRLGQRPVRRIGEKVSLSEVIRHKKPAFLGALLDRFKEHIKKKRTAAKQTRLVFLAPNKQAMFTLILVSLLLLLAIAYIALPGATIYLTPRSSVLDASFNVTFLDGEMHRDILASPSGNSILIATTPVNPPMFQKSFSHPATGKLFQGKNAEGIITVTNVSPAPWDLAARTRFQTSDGLIFRTPVPIRVPPGTLDVAVIADEFDAAGQVIGERGNITAQKFFLPGLKTEESRKKLFGENRAPFTGGQTAITKTVSQEDVKAAMEAARREVYRIAEEDLKRFLAEENIAKAQNLSLLADSHVIHVSEPKILLPENIIGRPAEQFEVLAQYEAAGLAFDRQELIASMKERVAGRADPDKKILQIAEEDISYKFLESDEKSRRVKLTATMRAIQIYDLDPDKENGRRFIKKITDHITGLRTDDAKIYLQQQSDQIAAVEIKTWPIWAPAIPNIADNIKFVIRNEEELK